MDEGETTSDVVLIPLGMSGLKLYLFGQQIAVDQPVSSRLG